MRRGAAALAFGGVHIIPFMWIPILAIYNLVNMLPFLGLCLFSVNANYAQFSAFVFPISLTLPEIPLNLLDQTHKYTWPPLFMIARARATLLFIALLPQNIPPRMRSSCTKTCSVSLNGAPMAHQNTKTP